MPDALAHKLTGIQLQEKAVKLNIHDRVVKFASGLEIKYDRLVSSLSLQELVNMAEGLPLTVKQQASSLRYNEVLNINIGIKPALSSDKHWIYFPEKKYPFYRVGYTSNLSRHNHPAGTSSLYIEIACRAGSLARMNKHQVNRLVNKSLAYLRQVNILEQSSRIVTLNTFKISPAYCIYDFSRTRNVTAIRSFLRKEGIYSVGRYGAWEYSAMEDALEWGRSTAEIIKRSYQ